MTNNSTSTSPFPQFADIMIMNVLGIIALIASFGNLFNLYLIYNSRRRQIVGTLLLANLGVADLMTGLLVMPLGIYSVVVQDTIPWSMCQLWAVLASLTIGVSFYTTAAISIDRCIAVANPFYYSQNINVSKLKLQIVILWLVTIVIAFMPILGLQRYGFGRYDYISGSLQCWINFKDTKNNLICAIVILSALSSTIIIIVTCYSIIFTIARRKDVQSPSGQGSVKKSIRTTSLIVGTSLICWTPLISLSYIEFFAPTFSTPSGIVLPAYLCTFCSSAINPIVYSLTNSELKRRIRRTFRRTNLVTGTWLVTHNNDKVYPYRRDSITGNPHSTVMNLIETAS